MFEVINGLSDLQIERFHEATEEVLEEVGFKVGHPELLRRARAAGARVDEASGRVCLPAPLLRELLAQVPSTYHIKGLDGIEYEIGGDSQHCLAIVTDPWIIDYETRQPRRPRIEDIRRHTRIAQQLKQVVAISLMDFPVVDFDGPASSLHAREEYLMAHSKHLLAMPTSTEDLRRWVDIRDIVFDGRGAGRAYQMETAVAVVSPLILTESNAEHLLIACRENLVVAPTVCPSAGVTSPYSMASTLLQENSEALFIAAMTQIVKPGHPVRYAMGPSVADMATGFDRYYTIDKVLWKLASVQLGKSYRLPTTAECGGSLNSRYDLQTGAEGVLFMLSAFASKANILAGIGSCYNAIGMSGEMMLIHTAWLEVAKFLGRGINADDLHLGIDSLKNGGPGANFLGDDLTIKLMRGKEFFNSELFDLTCELGSGDSMLERAHKKAEELVTNFSSPVPGEVQENLHRYFANLYRKLEK